MKNRKIREQVEKLPTVYEELKILKPLIQEMRALWSTCDLIERRFQLSEIKIGEPDSRTDAVESCGHLKATIESLLPDARKYHSEHLELVATWTSLGVCREAMTSPFKEYSEWLKSVVKLQFKTRSWRERIWLEIDGLPWTDAERSTITWQLLWESTPPKWLSLACHHHRLPLVSEPPALGGFLEALDRPGHRAKILTISQLADWAEARINEPPKAKLGQVGLVTE